MKTQEQTLRGIIRTSVTVENKILLKENKRICSNSKYRKIYTVTSKSSIRCKECESEKNRLYREKNLEKIKARQAKWRDENRESINSKRRDTWAIHKK